MERSFPTYALSRIIELIKSLRYRTTGTAVVGAGELGFHERDVVACVCGLISTDFYKSMESDRRPGFWQDVYRPAYCGIPIYVKVQLEGDDPDQSTVIIQFKRR